MSNRDEKDIASLSKLAPEMLLSAYTQGYFPMPDPETNEIAWYRPDPRAIFELDGFHVSKSLRKVISKEDYKITFSEDFEQVMRACADRDDTWITEEFISAYCRIHKLGFAHSVEVWRNEQLVGGTYGVCIRSAFFAESMFHRETNMSKIALWALTENLKKNNFKLLECQFMTAHLSSLGAKNISDEDYQKRLKEALVDPASFL